MATAWPAPLVVSGVIHVTSTLNRLPNRHSAVELVRQGASACSYVGTPNRPPATRSGVSASSAEMALAMPAMESPGRRRLPSPLVAAANALVSWIGANAVFRGFV